MSVRFSSLALVGALLLPACGGGGGSSSNTAEDFTFQTSSEPTLELTVTLDGAAAQNAIVLLVPPIPEPPEGMDVEDVIDPDVYLRGFTDSEGVIDRTLSLPIDVDEVDIIVDLRSATGPYTDESLRTRWGPTAPASRTTHDVDSLSSVTIALESE